MSSYQLQQLPVFVFPNSLTFYSEEQVSHKQVLTLYNPYDFALRFRVLATAPKKYTLIDPEGTIKPRCCIDIVIRHVSITMRNIGTADKFRIQIFEHGRRTVLGRRDVQSTLVAGLPPEHGLAGELSATGAMATGSEQGFEAIPSTGTGPAAAVTGLTASPREYHLPTAASPDGAAGAGHVLASPSIFVVSLCAVCVLALLMPTVHHEDTSSSTASTLQAQLSIPHYLHLTVQQKLIAAYILGLLTMVILRT